MSIAGLVLTGGISRWSGMLALAQTPGAAAAPGASPATPPPQKPHPATNAQPRPAAAPHAAQGAPAAAAKAAQPAAAQPSTAKPAAAQPAAQPAPAPPAPFTYATLVQLARDRAAHPHENRSPKLPQSLARLTYDQYRDIRFRRVDALWRNQSLFEVQFFHRGFNFDRRVNINQVVDGQVHPVVYDPAWFEFGRRARLPATLKLPPELGFAGFRVHYPLQTPSYKDELIVFLGASYFRVLGRNQVYGISARGLAINTASSDGEEFPWFTDFWLVKPSHPEQRTLTIYALLDSPSVAGAYQFEVTPGSITRVKVSCELFARRTIEKLGIAPLTSMFLYGEDTAGHRFDDYRPEVHDSDGLMEQTGSGEWLWRPLVNPHALEVNRFMDQAPRGFGLIQRDRDFNHYQDNESRFERRPSYWIEPDGDWGKGGVELVEIPTDEEIHDNIVSYWVPSAPVQAGKPLKFSYVLSAFSQSALWPPGGRVIATRTGNAPGASNRNALRLFVIDFAGGDLDGLDASQPVKAQVSANGGRLRGITVERLPENGVWRVSFRVPPGSEDNPLDLRCYLTLYGEALTETWTYQTAT